MVGPMVFHAWQQLDSFVKFVAIVMVPAVGVTLFLAALPFAYWRAVTQIERRRTDGLESQTASKLKEDRESNHVSGAQPLAGKADTSPT